uniref:Amine oxidase n=1 Tax=Plectus sambesii TaxID=2011161 RepID=A0A914W0C2_9BILA
MRQASSFFKVDQLELSLAEERRVNEEELALLEERMTEDNQRLRDANNTLKYQLQALLQFDQDSTSTDPPTPSVITYDAVTARGTPALIGFADFGRDYSKEMRRQAYLSVMEQFFGDDVNHFLGFSDQEWSKDAYSKGCFAVLAPGKMPANFTQMVRAPTNERVIWAGTETATVWMGYMNGAVQAGRRAAGDVLDIYKIEHNLHVPLNHSAALQLSKTLFAILTVLSLALLLI